MPPKAKTTSKPSNIGAAIFGIVDPIVQRFAAGSLQAGFNDFRKEVLDQLTAAGRDVLKGLSGEQLAIVQQAATDLAALQFDALVNPSQAEAIKAEMKHPISTLKSEAGLAAIKAEQRVLAAIGNVIARLASTALAAI